MVQIPLSLVKWQYDTETNKVFATFIEAPNSDDPDPVNFISQQVIEVELHPISIEMISDGS